MHYLLFDISNLLYRTFFVNREGDDQLLAGIAAHSALMTLNKYFKRVKPDKVVMAFDRKSWRKDYTASSLCISKKPYKGTRRQDMTPAQQLKYKLFMQHMKEFEQLIIENTTVITLVEDHLEADDLIAGFCQKMDGTDSHVTIISTDSDLLQLLKHENVSIISPDSDKEQKLDDFDNDPAYYIFTKCLRGDRTDNVQSAFPRVRSTRIRKAFDDAFERVQLMKETWKDENDVEYIVEDLFEENEMLINLEKQPDTIRRKIENTVNQSLDKDREFSLFHILKFCGKYKLIKVKEQIDQYIPLLSQ